MLLVVKNMPANARNIRDVGLIPGSGRSPGGGHGNPHHHHPAFLPGESHGQRRLVGYSPWARQESWLKRLSTHIEHETSLGQLNCELLLPTVCLAISPVIYM